MDFDWFLTIFDTIQQLQDFLLIDLATIDNRQVLMGRGSSTLEGTHTIRVCRESTHKNVNSNLRTHELGNSKLRPYISQKRRWSGLPMVHEGDELMQIKLRKFVISIVFLNIDVYSRTNG